MELPTEVQVVKAARKLCQLSSEACGVNNDDNWFIYGEMFIEDAREVLTAVFAGEQS